MGVLWMVDGVFCRDPALGFALEERAAARAASEEHLQAERAVSLEGEPQPRDSYFKKFPAQHPQQVPPPAPHPTETAEYKLPLPPPNSEVAAQPRADLENRAESMPKEWEPVSAIKRGGGVHRRLDTLDSSTSTVRDLMSRAVLTATSSTTIQEASNMLKETEFQHLPVVNEEQKLIGLVSDRDLLGRDGELKDRMVPRVLTSSPDTPLEQAAQALAKERFHSLVVIDEERRPIGVLTSSDLLTFLVGHPAMRLWR